MPGEHGAPENQLVTLFGPGGRASPAGPPDAGAALHPLHCTQEYAQGRLL